MNLLKSTFAKRSRTLALAAVVVASALAVGAVAFNSQLSFNPGGGSLASYLIGAVDGRHDGNGCFGNACFQSNFGSRLASSDTFEAVVRLVNPTDLNLRAFIAAYDDHDFFLDCRDAILGANAYAELALIDIFGQADSRTFSVKVLTVDQNNKVQAGVKGWLTHYLAETSDFGARRFLHMRETELEEVPVAVARAGEAQRIIDDCTSVFQALQ